MINSLLLIKRKPQQRTDGVIQEKRRVLWKTVYVSSNERFIYGFTATNALTEYID